MATDDARGSTAPEEPSVSNTAATAPGGAIWKAVKRRWRGWLRAIHRDVGYLVIGLTVIYAVSGLAINHLHQWDPNYVTYSHEQTIAPIAASVPDARAIEQVRTALDLGTPRSTYRAGDEIHLEYDYKKVVVYGDSGLAIEQGREPRFFLRVANWLHYNRGKKAWTYVADAYAILLLYLACSGLFMIKGKKGLRWRGAVLLTLGAGVPIGYVAWSGGPSARRSEAATSTPADEPAPTPDQPSGDDDDGPVMRPRVLRQPPGGDGEPAMRPPVLRQPPADGAGPASAPPAPDPATPAAAVPAAAAPAAP